MRLPEARIKEAIVHPEKLVRQEALLYFAGCYSRDAEVMPLAIKAIETYGRSSAFLDVHLLAHLAQTKETVQWAIRELQREEQAADQDIYFNALSQLLCSADLQLLIPYANEVLPAPGFFEPLAPGFQERLQLASYDAEQCWQELDRISAQGVLDYSSSEDVDTGHASRVVEALARQGERYVDRILTLLGKEVEDFENDPMTWMEIFLVELAGDMRLEAAIPLIVHKLRLYGDLLSEECVKALARIGTDAVTEAVTEGWLKAEWDYRLDAASVLEKIHSDATVRKCLELLPQDEDINIRTSLACALLAQFADEGIEPVRQMVERRAYDDMTSDVMRKLVTVSTIMGVAFPEYPIWKREVEEKLARQERRMKEMRGFARLPAQPTSQPTAAPSKERDFLDRKPAPFIRTEPQVGRNDPCPCGSGKKFKKCCMSRGK
jgi:SEC-C motif